MRAELLFALAVVMVVAMPAMAQDGGSAIESFQGPVVNSNRVIGLGGAYIGIADDADGHLSNPASFSHRNPRVSDRWFHWDLALSFQPFVGGDGTRLDLAESEADLARVLFGQLGVNLKFARHGAGMHVALQSYQIAVPSLFTTRVLQYDFTLGGAGYSYTWGDGDATTGVLFTQGSTTIRENGAEVLRLEGDGVLFGLLWSPVGQPFRFGSTFRTPISAKALPAPPGEEGAPGVPDIDRVAIPWELGFGVSWQHGPRPFNVRPLYLHRAERRARPPEVVPREYLLVATDLIVTGASHDAMGLTGYLAGDSEPAGETMTLGVRAGVESEVVADRLVLRGGSYVEPSRFGTGARPHLTGGGDLHVHWIAEWKFALSFDVAEGYSNIGIGLGFWH